MKHIAKNIGIAFGRYSGAATVAVDCLFSWSLYKVILC